MNLHTILTNALQKIEREDAIENLPPADTWTIDGDIELTDAQVNAIEPSEILVSSFIWYKHKLGTKYWSKVASQLRASND